MIIPIGAKVCKIHNEIFLYPDQMEEIRAKLTEMNKILMGSCSVEGAPEGWYNLYPPNCYGVIYEKINENTYKRIELIS